MPTTSQSASSKEFSHADSQRTDAKPLRIAIIGAGLTGLMSADLLEKAFAASKQNVYITVFEKSAGVGRLATRYKKPSDVVSDADTRNLKQWQFDFGAQFFTAKSESFRSYLQPWLEQKVVEPWLAKTAQAHNVEGTSDTYHIAALGQWDDAQPRYISSPKMTSFGRELAKIFTHTTLNYKTRVAPLQRMRGSELDSSSTQLFDEQGNDLGGFDWVVCTAPQDQAIELLAQTDFEYQHAIKAPKMLACYTLMLGWGEQQILPESLQSAEWDVLDITEIGSALGRLFIENHKPGREHVLPSLTVHASNLWAQKHVDDDLESVKQQMLDEVQKLLGWQAQSAPTHVDCHRWRFAATQQPKVSEKIAYVDAQKQWIVTGDWCDEGRIESCFHAANEVVKTIVG